MIKKWLAQVSTGFSQVAIAMAPELLGVSGVYSQYAVLIFGAY